MTTITNTDGSVIDLRTIRKGDLLYEVFAKFGCNCCKRAVDDLRPFGKSGDPIEGDFEGAILVKRSRPFDPPDEEADMIYEEFFAQCETESDWEHAWKRLVEKYGQEKAEDLETKHLMSITLANYWECRDCIVLDDDEYFAVRNGQPIEELKNRDKRKRKGGSPIEPLDASWLSEMLGREGRR